MSSPAPPSESDVRARAERAAGWAGAGSQATVWWGWTPAAGGGWSVEVVVVRDGRIGRASGEAGDDDALRACVEAAAAAAADGPEGLAALPQPTPGRTHDGYDPAVLRLGDEPRRAGLAKVAIASAAGGTVFEQRTFVAVGVPGGEVAAVSVAGAEASARDAGAPADDGPAAAAPDDIAGDLPAVLGPQAVAAVLDRLRPLFGRPGALPQGRRVAAACISLSESPRFAATLPRSYDVHGTPRQPVPLIQDGVAHRTVSAETGHAVRAGHADAEPQHLVLVGGGAASEAELLAPIARGLYLPSLDRALLVEDGRATRAVAADSLQIDPLAVLAGAQALTARQRTIPTAGDARTVGATVCPALRTGGGVRLSG
ncbi:MAG TPA: metallopeptidase TldD-related protein [Solirubrobacteraceae bacterium]